MGEITTRRAVFENHLVAALTSGIRQRGPNYRLPESMAVEYGRLCYNQAIKDMLDMCRASDFGQTGLEICDAIQGLNIHQRDVM